MKKTLITLLALSGLAMGAYTVHDTTFNVNTTDKGYQNQSPTTNNLYVTEGKTSWGSSTTIQGLYMADGAGIQFNTGDTADPVVITYLYIGNSISITDDVSTCVAGTMAWNRVADRNIEISSQSGAWLDINADHGSYIDVTSMTTGSIYLNTAGALTLGSALSNDVTVYATVTDSTRTLLSGTDLTGWTGTVVLQNADGTAYTGTDYIYETSATGLSIVAAPVEPGDNVPEPTTATLSLLALAGLAARRRRK